MSRPLNFRQIEAFRAVMLAGTTTGAAELLHTTQPSISRLLAQVQQATGLKLFDMERGRLRPTREARELFDTVQRHFTGLESIENRVAAMRRSGTGMLRVACTPALALGVLPEAIERFAAEFPGVHINLQTVGSHYLRDGLMHGLYDLALTTAPLASLQSEVRVLHRTSAVCVMNARHELAGRSAIDVGDLADRRLLVLNATDDVYQQLRAVMLSHGVEAASETETTYSFNICALAAAGSGLGVVNPYIASVFSDRLAILPFTPSLPVEVSLAWPAQFAPSDMTDRFVRILETQFRGLPA